jgi:hypothetical protein
MNPDKQNKKNEELNTLLTIVNSYYQLPVDFCLKEFLGWDDSKIKTFNKERKKTKKNILKEYNKVSNKAFSFDSCCENTGQG